MCRSKKRTTPRNLWAKRGERVVRHNPSENPYGLSSSMSFVQPTRGVYGGDTSYVHSVPVLQPGVQSADIRNRLSKGR